MTPQEAFAEGRYFVAHELWEREWLEAEGDERTFLQGLIQMAVALHHRSRGNGAGFRKLRERALPKLGRVAHLCRLLEAVDVVDGAESALREAILVG